MIDDTLALLDEMNEAGRIEYDDYRALHDAVSVIALPAPDAERPYCPVHGDLLAGVRSERCRTAGEGHEMDADVAERIARAIEEAGADWLSDAMTLGACYHHAARIARSHATPMEG